MNVAIATLIVERLDFFGLLIASYRMSVIILLPVEVLLFPPFIMILIIDTLFNWPVDEDLELSFAVSLTPLARL